MMPLLIHYYSRKEDLPPEDRHLLDTPLETQLLKPPHKLRAWFNLWKPVLDSRLPPEPD